MLRTRSEGLPRGSAGRLRFPVLLLGAALFTIHLGAFAPSADAVECALPAACPDLRVDGITASRVNATYTVSVTIVNDDILIDASQCDGLITLWSPQDEDCNHPKMEQYFPIPAIAKSTSWTGSVTVDAWPECDHYKCCSVCADVNDTINEDQEDNNYKNVNTIYGNLTLNVTTMLQGTLSNACSSPVQTEWHNTITFSPTGWDTNVEPAVSMVDPDDIAVIEVEYFAPFRARSDSIVVTSTLMDVPMYQQTNVFHLRFDVGACCFGDGSCQVLPESDCAVEGGSWMGAGAPCDPDPCSAPVDEMRLQWGCIKGLYR